MVPELPQSSRLLSSCSLPGSVGHIHSQLRPDQEAKLQLLETSHSDRNQVEDPAGTRLGPSRNQAGTTQEADWNHVGNTQEPDWNHGGTKLEPRWNQAGQ